MDKIPVSILSLLRKGADGKQAETIKPAQVDVKLHDEILIGSIDLAIKALMQTGDELGYRTKRSEKYLVNDIEFEKNRIINECSDLFAYGGDKSIMVWGGEVTVKRSEGGRGGRNQHLALLLAEEFKRMKGAVGVALATDGEDGSTDAAGAVIDSTTMGRAGALGLDYQRAIREQESYGFFLKLNDLIYTGPTGTNVNDIIFIIREDIQNGYKE
jgi:glycerate-2-kinase